VVYTSLTLAQKDCARLTLVSLSRTNFGDRAFSAAGPRVCNYLPTDLRQPDLSDGRLRQSLKTFLLGGWDKAHCESTF